jgi:hypothetical protein
MNPFQKQALTQATGMDVSALMGLQQGKGGELTGDLKAEKAKGAAFAQGALSADISGAAAKLALEQEQRAKLLAFEQRQRMIMLQLEQAQRLDGIFLEQKWRAKAAEKDYKNAKQDMAADVAAESASGFLTNQMSGNASSLNRAGLTDAATIKTFTDKIAGVDNSVSNLISSQQIKGTDMRLVEYLTQKDDILANVQNKTPEQIQAAITAAYDKIFAVEKENLEKAKVLEQDRLINIAKALDSEKNVKNGRETGAFDEYAKKYKVSEEEIKKAQALLNPNTKRTPIGTLQSFGVGLDEKKVAALRANNKPTVQSNVNSPTGKDKPVVKPEVVNKPVVDTLKTNAEKQIIATQKTMDIPLKELSEAQYGIKIQKEMVALLGINAQFLQQISENTVKEGGININGRTLGRVLLNQARSTYGVARTA